jgi:hypothetical protein
MFPVNGGKCLSRKAVHNWVEKRGKSFAHDEDVETEVWKWLRQQPKDFYAAGFDALVKQWDTCIKVGGGYVETQMSFELPISYILRFIFVRIFTKSRETLLNFPEYNRKLSLVMTQLDFREKALETGEGGGGHSNWSQDRVTLHHTNGYNKNRSNIIRVVC